MIPGAKMDMEYTFHIPKIIVSLNKLTWSEKASSHKIILPQQTITLFSLISLCLKLWTMAWQIVLVMVSEWAEYQMSTRVRSLWLELRAVSSTLCSFDEDMGVGQLPFLSPDSLCTFPSLLCSLQGWPLWVSSTAPYPLASVWVWPTESSGGSSHFLIFHSGTCVLSLWTDCSNVGCLTTLDTHFFLD